MEELGTGQALPVVPVPLSSWSPPACVAGPVDLSHDLEGEAEAELQRGRRVRTQLNDVVLKQWYKILIRAPICIKSERMQVSHPNSSFPLPDGSPKLCVYLLGTWQPLELANRNVWELSLLS